MIAVTAHANGAVLPVRAKPGAKINDILDEYNGALRVSVSAPPEDGKANEAIIRVLAENFDRRRSTIHLLSGASSRDKKFLFENITVAELIGLIESVIEPTMTESPDPDV